MEKDVIDVPIVQILNGASAVVGVNLGIPSTIPKNACLTRLEVTLLIPVMLPPSTINSKGDAYLAHLDA